MRTATAYASGWVHAILLAAALGCGGGGGDSYDGDTGMAEPTYTLARFEFARGHCQFDSERMREIAAAQYPAEYAQCSSIYTGNRRTDGSHWPNPKSWPSTPRLS